MAKRKIIDAHTHVFPDKIASRAVANVGSYYNITMGINGSARGKNSLADTQSSSPIFGSPKSKEVPIVKDGIE